ncbi:MAG: TIGR02452 family protein, partial [archaeon]|nr:TIGR02452 family protein [archaeon]
MNIYIYMRKYEKGNKKRNEDFDKPLGQLPPVIKNKYAIETIEIFNKGYYKNSKGETINVKEMIDKSIEGTILYQPDTLRKIPNEGNNSGKIEITEEYSLDASQRIVKEGILNPVCLNFASARNPGGGFCGLNEAQEENICRSSALYLTENKFLEMYKFNRQNKTLLYSDYMIYSPNVPVWRNTKYELLDEPYCISFITSPAVNCSNRNTLEEIKSTMFIRCKKIIETAIENNCKGMILGSFGCGVFKNKPEDVAEYFRNILYDIG